MSSPPIAARASARVADAAGLMLKHKVHRIPVVNARAELVGIVTRTDIFTVRPIFDFFFLFFFFGSSGGADVEVEDKKLRTLLTFFLSFSDFISFLLQPLETKNETGDARRGPRRRQLENKKAFLEKASQLELDIIYNEENPEKKTF